jgi:hypothetical protein
MLELARRAPKATLDKDSLRAWTHPHLISRTLVHVRTRKTEAHRSVLDLDLRNCVLGLARMAPKATMDQAFLLP